MTEPHVLEGLARTWWFPSIAGYRSGPKQSGTYYRFDLDEQPAVPADLGTDLRWLHDRPRRSTWAITQDDDGAHTNVLTAEKLTGIMGAHPVAPALRNFVERRQLQSKIRSCTGCFLDLGDFAVPITGDRGVFCHVLSDQQWVKHWLVYCGPGPKNGTVVVADQPYGFDTDGEFDEDVPRSINPGDATDLEVCADSFEEFIYRFWIENELYFSMRGEPITDPHVERYADQLEP